MIPWTKAEIYNGVISFKVDTNFFFPELEYEVFVRLKDKEFVRTSNLTHKFRLTEDGPTHLANRNANPYNNRYKAGDV